MLQSNRIALPVRIDLHCHSMASTEADEAVLNALNCPESYSHPEEVYAQAKGRGMDWVTITDHDSIAGVTLLNDRPDVITGEELTCYFPEDGCKMHVLIWGITPADHDALQAVARDIYKVARYIARHRIAHAVAHPLYRQNDLLEKWHLERLMLLFKGFECLNGAHSMLHRQAFEPMLDELTAQRVAELTHEHELPPLWPMPHVKARTGGSDDHGLYNIGRTWTAFPAKATTAEQILECLRTGDCAPGGEAGSSLKLAHNFYSVGVRYYSRQFVSCASKPSWGAVLMQKLVGEKPPYRKRDMVKMAFASRLRALGGKLIRPLRRKTAPAKGVDLLLELFKESLAGRMGAHGDLAAAVQNDRAPLAEHESVFSLICGLNRDISEGIAASVEKSLGRGELSGVFDALSTIGAHQFTLLPYYFALFHQNRERQVMARVTGRPRNLSSKTMRVALFTDTLDDVNGVSRFSRDLLAQAQREGVELIAHTCTATPRFESPARKNFQPLLSRRFPMYAHLELNMPPLLEVLEWCDRRQFDAIYIDTPGGMGLCGLLAASMLRVPVLGTYHTDFPAYVKNFTGDFRLTTAATAFMRWFYSKMDRVFSRTREYATKLEGMGIAQAKLALAPPAIDTEVFNPSRRDSDIWRRLGVREARKLFFCGRVSVEKNLPMLVEVFKRLCLLRKDTALVIAGDGPYMEKMKQELSGRPVYFLGFQDDRGLAPLYASSDLFVFPSRTDTMGQVVIEAQASGLPVLVSGEGGPREVMADGVSGLVLPGDDVNAWALAIHGLLNDEPRRARMGHCGPLRTARFSLEAAFEGFWSTHLEVVRRADDRAARPGAHAAPVEEPVGVA